MSYFEELDAWFTAIISSDEDEDAEEWYERVKKQVKDKILESYRNGQKAGLKPSSKTSAIAEPRETRPAPKRKFWPPRRRDGPRDE